MRPLTDLNVRLLIENNTALDILILKTAVSSVVQHTLSMRKVYGLISGPVKSAKHSQRLATFLRDGVARR